MADKPEILALIARYLNNPDDLSCKSQIEQYRNQSKENDDFFREIERLWHFSSRSATLDKVDDKIAINNFKERLSHISTAKQPKIAKLKKPTFIRWVAASVVLLMMAGLAYFYTGGIIGKEVIRPYASDANPGGNKAILVLADGRKISLTDINNGDVAKEAGLSITKTADGQLVYNVLSEEGIGNNKNDVFNTIETPKGGMWQVRLPDGSMVWLNAASSLTYPLSFSKGKKRVVELKGEAYFEVAKDKLHPFIVKTAKQEVEVLGTSFNINSYADEAAVKTTLLEGSIRVYPNQADIEANILVPDEQAVLTAKGMDINKIDADETIDWKNGYFMFNNEKQESIMRKIARWYNVQIEYADLKAKDVTYYGSISRFEKVSQILRKFEQTGEVRFEIDNNKIIVYKEK